MGGDDIAALEKESLIQEPSVYASGGEYAAGSTLIGTGDGLLKF